MEIKIDDFTFTFDEINDVIVITRKGQYRFTISYLQFKAIAEAFGIVRGADRK